MFDHLSTLELRDHIARLETAVRRPTGIAYTLADLGADHRELEALREELRVRGALR